MAQVIKEIVVKNAQGLHARPAAMFVQIASRYNSAVTIQKDDEKVNGKSIMGIMTLAAGVGSAITVRTEGIDAQKAINEISKLVMGNFGE